MRLTSVNDAPGLSPSFHFRAMGDDVMADVAYRNRKGAGSARKELLESVGDGLKVSDEGVLGGANDEIFGGRQRFGQFKADQNKEDNKNALRGESQATQERGADGGEQDDAESIFLVCDSFSWCNSKEQPNPVLCARVTLF